MIQKLVVNQNLKEKSILIVLFTCLLGWTVVIDNVQVYGLHPSDFGPFQYLPIVFWPLLAIACYLNFISTKEYTKITSMLVLSLLVVGSLSMIEPCGRLHDSWRNVALSSLIFEYGTINYGVDYVSSYPAFFLILGTLEEVSGISPQSVVQFTPMLSIILYLFGFIFLVKSMLLFNDNFVNDSVQSVNIYGNSFLFLVIFGLALFGLRTNPAPQTLALILFIYNISLLLREKTILVSIIFTLMFLSIVMMHAITSAILVGIIFLFSIYYVVYLRALYEERHLINLNLNVVLLLIFISWTLYVAFFAVEYGTTFLLNLLSIDHTFSVAEVGRSVAITNKFYLQIRQILIIVTAFLLMSSFISITIKNKNLALLLVILSLPTLVLYPSYIFGLAFSDRALVFSSIFGSLVFGFGFYYLLYDKKKYIYSLRYLLISLTIVSAFLAILTANNTDAFEMITPSECSATNFAVDYIPTPAKIIYGFSLPTAKYENIYNFDPAVTVLKRERFGIIVSDPYEFRNLLLNSRGKYIFVSEQWIYRRAYLEKTEVPALVFIEKVFRKEINTLKLYDNIKFRIYYRQ